MCTEENNKGFCRNHTNNSNMEGMEEPIILFMEVRKWSTKIYFHISHK